jgi:hypothetical protein
LSCAFGAARRWNGAIRPGSAGAAASSSVAAKASARTTDVELVVLAYVAGQAVLLEESERNAAVRRALLVFAAGGDLHRDPALGEPAVAELARDLDAPDRREALLAALDGVEHAEPLRADPDLAWRAYACGLLADELGS